MAKTKPVKTLSKKAKGKTKKAKVPPIDKASAAKKWAKDSLPLLHALKSFKNGKERATLLGYLNDEACESIYHMIANVLRNTRVNEGNQSQLAKTLDANRSDLRKLMAGRKLNEKDRIKQSAFKRKILVKMGGGIFSTLLTLGIPILMSLISRKK